MPVWGTQVTTPMVNEEYAKVNVKTSIVRPAGSPADDYRLSTLLVDGRGNTVARTETVLRACDYDLFEQELVVKEPMLWSPETPALYTAVSRLYEGETLKDEYKTRFGIRSIEVIPGKGFFLNGEKTIFRGVCLHHDLGPLGGAVNKAAIERQLRILKDMGCNAIRTSHNMPAPELVDACDEMGIMMMAESFDEWAQPKCQNGYNLLFDEWAEKDLVNLVRHYRNNPCVVMWSIGNEIPEQGVRGGNQIARFLRDICHREDPTRPVTQGMNNVEGVVSNGFASVMDIVGLNYHPGLYPKAYELLPQQLVLGAETISALSSRGIYKFPLERRVMHKYDDHQASSYGVDHVGWGCLPEDHFIQYEDYPWCMGEFVWTGFDYLGEPTPYYSDWPSHSSLFGIVDLAGIPKDLYYLYRSFWNPEEETLHILPHWNWEGREGEVTPVFVYTNYPSAELFINGKSQGKRTKDLSVKVQDSGDKDALNAFERQKRYRLMWMDTKYEPGTLKVVAYDAEGKLTAKDVKLTLIPYYAWAHRGAGNMMVWLPQDVEASSPALPPTPASQSKVDASCKTAALPAVNDRLVPADANDRSVPYYHWWPRKGTTEWLSYEFPKPVKAVSATVYWFDDAPWGGCRVPQAWKLYYKDSRGRWMPVEAEGVYGLEKGVGNTVRFAPVETSAMKLEVTLPADNSAGIYEWEIEGSR